MSHLLQPTILLLKDGSDTAQGRTHIIHNINACQAIAEILKTTLGPRGMDKLIYTSNGNVTISNDGRTIIDLLDIIHPAAKTLIDIAIAQDNEVGDGTTTVIILASEFLKQAKIFIEDGVHSQTIIRAYRKSQQCIIDRIKKLSINFKENQSENNQSDNNNNNNNDDTNYDYDWYKNYNLNDILLQCASTTLQSKLIASHKKFFSNIVVNAVRSLDSNKLDLNLIGIEKVAGGSVTESQLVQGVAFKKTFSYAGFEQQPKTIKYPKILCLNIELELKAEKENAEIRLNDPNQYQSIIDAEWKIIYDKLDCITKSGANLIFSRLAIGDLATQYFADHNIFCAGRVPEDVIKRICSATGAVVQTSLGNLVNTTNHDNDNNNNNDNNEEKKDNEEKPNNDDIIGKCNKFYEQQIGSERYNFLIECPNQKTSTIILRGGSQQFIEETHRSLWDALNVVKRCMQYSNIVGGGGGIEMELSRYLRDVSKQIKDKSQLIMTAYSKALEIIPRQLAHNAGLDSTDIINKLRFKHATGNRWFGVDIENGNVFDTLKNFVWEPTLNKISSINAATEAACTILAIDETIKNAKAPSADNQQMAPVPGQRPTGMPSIR